MSETWPPDDELEWGESGSSTRPDASEPPEQDEPLPSEPTPPTPKRTIAWGWFFLGFATPFAVLAATVFASSTEFFTSDVPGFFLVGLQALNVAAFAGAILAFAFGRAQEKDSLRSFGLGALVAYGTTLLLSLLVFGACFVTLSNWGK